jgi:predicted ATPase
MYPFKVLSGVGMFRLDFEPITILYGGNGSGKSTALNVISQKLHIERQSAYNSGELMDTYVGLCSFETDMRWTGEEFSTTGHRSGRYDISEISCMITSDDIFKALLQDRVSREQTLIKSRMLTDKAGAIKMGRWADFKFSRHLDLESGENIQQYKEAVEIRKKSVSKYLRDKLGKEEPGMSNGENSFVYMSELLKKEGLYLLDEPENSLSPEMQMKLSDLLVYMARYNNSQIIMATHSPFLLSTPCAKIYNLDGAPACVSKFEKLEAMRVYYEFFISMKDKFEV